MADSIPDWATTGTDTAPDWARQSVPDWAQPSAVRVQAPAPINPNAPEGFNSGGTSRKIEPDTALGEDFWHDLYQNASRPAVAIPKFTVNADDSRPTAVAKTLGNLVTSLPEFLESPAGIATVAGGGVVPKTVAGLFLGQTAKSVTDQAKQAGAEWDQMTPAQKAAALTEIGGETAFAGLLGHGAGGKLADAIDTRVNPAGMLARELGRTNPDWATKPGAVPIAPLQQAAPDWASPDARTAQAPGVSTDLLQGLQAAMRNNQMAAAEPRLGTSSSPLRTPIPETPATLQAQVEATKDPNSPKAVTLVTPGADLPVGHGLTPVETKQGTALVNADKVDPATAKAQLDAGGGGQLLGMSTDAKPTEALNGQRPAVAVQTKTANGTVLQDEVATPETLPAAVQAAKALAPNGTVEIKAPDQVIQERQQATHIENVRTLLNDLRDASSQFKASVDDGKPDWDTYNAQIAAAKNKFKSQSSENADYNVRVEQSTGGYASKPSESLYVNAEITDPETGEDIVPSFDQYRISSHAAGSNYGGGKPLPQIYENAPESVASRTIEGDSLKSASPNRIQTESPMVKGATIEPNTAAGVKLLPVKVSDSAVKAMRSNVEAAPDILDAIGDHYPNGVKFGSKADYGEYLNQAKGIRGGTAKELMSHTEGEDADKVLQNLHREGLALNLETPDDLAQAMIEADQVRAGAKGGRDAEARLLAEQQARDQQFQQANRASRPNSEPVPVEHLQLGDRFKLNGYEHTVTGFPIDAETQQPFGVEIEGPYGKQIVPVGQALHVDTGTLSSDINSGALGTVGMGGAKPSEFENPRTRATAIKNAAVDLERQRRGLPPAMQAARRGFGDVWNQAMSIVSDQPERTDKLIEELKAQPRALTDTEDALLLQRQIELHNEYDKALRELAQANDDAKQFPNRLADAAEWKLRTAELSDKLLELYDINKAAGTETGRGLAARKMMAYEDYSLANMELQMRAAKGGGPLTAEEHDQISKLQERIAKTEKDFQDYREQAEQKLAERRAQEEIDARIKAVEQAPGYDRQVQTLADRIVSALEAEAVKARARLKEKFARTSAGVDPTILGDLSIIGASHIARGVVDFSRWSKAMVDELGESVVPWLNQAWAKANERVDTAVDRVAKGKKSIAVRQKVRKEDTTGQRAEITTALKNAQANGAEDTLQGDYVRKLAESFIRDGVREREPLIDAVHKVLTEDVGLDWTRRETMDAISGYGRFKALNPDEVKVTLRDLKGQMQQVAKLEDIQSKRPLQKTGLERRTPGDEERRLIQQVNEAKRRFGVVVTDPARQLKSALEAVRTRLTHQIADLEYQIATKARTVKTRTPAPWDAETKLLEVRRDELSKQLDALVPRPGVTDAQRLAAATKNVERSIEDYSQRIAAKDVSARSGRPTPSSPQLEALKARRAQLRAEWEELRSHNEEYQRAQAAADLENHKAALERTISARQEMLRTGQIEPKPRAVNRPADPLLETLMQHRDELGRQIAELRKGPAKSPEEKALAALKTRLANSTAEWQERLARGDFQPKARRVITLDPEAQRLKAANIAAKQEFQRALIAKRLADRPLWQRGMDTFVRWRRGFLLSSPVTLGKLTAAAVQRLIVTPAEEAVGAAWSTALPRLAEAAPREGGGSVAIEAKAITAAFTKGMKDSANVLRTGRGEKDVLYGGRADQAVAEHDVVPPSVIDFFGHLHGALKAPVKAAEFERSFQKRIAWNMRRGVDVSDPLVQTRVALEAYRDANRSIFLQDNRVVSAYKRWLSAYEQKPTFGSKLAATSFRTLLPIVRVPTNLVAETFQYALGIPSGLGRLGLALKNDISKLPPDQADMIMRHLKKGSLGAAVLTAGFLMPNAIGGYYQPGQKRAPGDVPAGRVRIGDWTVPTWLLHNPLLETLQLGATVRRVADSKLRKHDAEAQGIGPGLQAGALGLTEEVPFVREMLDAQKAFEPNARGAFTGELLKSITVPQLVQWAAQQTDKDAAGNVIPRKPATAWQHIETGIPGLRSKVPPNAALMRAVRE